MKRNKKKYKRKSKYAVGGMYADNTVQSAGQGARGTTSNIVFDESNPAVLKQKLQFLAEQRASARQSGATIAEEILKQDQIDQQKVLAAKASSDAKFAAGESVVKSGLGTIKKGLDLAQIQDKKPPVVADVAASVAPAAGVAQGAGDFVTKLPGAELGTPLQVTGGQDLMKTMSSFQAPAPTAPVSAPYVPPTSKIPVASPTYDLSKATVTDASGNITGVKGGIGAGIKAFKAQRATNQAIKSGKLLASSAGSATKAGWGAMSAGAKGNLIGAAAGLAGAGLKKWGGDEDDTELNTAEWSGELLSGAGTGIGIASTAGTIAGAVGMGSLWGSAVPGLGTAIGAVAGLGYGAYKALAGRKKARQAEAKALEEKKRRVGKYNKKVASNLVSAQLGATQGELEQKTYSGYDLGRNITYRGGGMRMGMPRYGYAA